MMSTIHKDWHYSLPPRPWIWWGRTRFTWVVKFDESCRYDLDNDDQYDTNKLVGIGYLPHHHKNSARFGWRYSKERDEIELSAYCYVNSKRIIQSVGFVKIGQWCRINLTVATFYYHFNMEVMDSGCYLQVGDTIVDQDNQRELQYHLGPYFGGNRKAPHAMTIQFKRL